MWTLHKVLDSMNILKIENFDLSFVRHLLKYIYFSQQIGKYYMHPI